MNIPITASWRSTMRDVVTAIKVHFNFRHDSQVADLIGISRQHIHVAVRENRLIPDKLLESCIVNDIDVTRLLRDAKAVKVSDVDYSESQIKISHFREGEVLLHRENWMQKWYVEKLIGRTVEINESFQIVSIETDEMEPRIHRDSLVVLDPSEKEPKGGIFYLEVDGYGVLRRLVKGNGINHWQLLAGSQVEAESVEFNKDFRVIGKAKCVTSKL